MQGTSHLLRGSPAQTIGAPLRNLLHAKVAFGTEAGLVHVDMGVPSVACGPGHVDVAHKADEFVEQARLDRCDAAILALCGS